MLWDRSHYVYGIYIYNIGNACMDSTGTNETNWFPGKGIPPNLRLLNFVMIQFCTQDLFKSDLTWIRCDVSVTS